MWRNLSFKIRKISEKGSFLRHVSIASSWNVAVIISQFFLSPVITRLYDPSQYGIYALFSSIVVNIVIFSTLKYSDTIVLAENHEQRNNSIALSFLLIFIFSILSLLVISLFGEQVALFLNVPEAGYILYLIPIGVILTSSLEVLLTINIRRKKFFNNGLSGFLNGTGARTYNIVIALLTQARASGLIMGDFLGKIIGIICILFSFKKGTLQTVKESVREVTWLRMKAVAVKHKSFPIYFLPSSVLIYLSGHLPLYFFQLEYGAAVVGGYALANSMLEIFNRLIPYALSPVFLQKANELKNISMDHLASRVYKLFGYVMLLSTVIFAGIALLSETFFPMLFGEKWVTAGMFAALLAVQYAFNFVAVALSEVYNVLGRQRFLFANTIFNVTLKVISFVLIIYLKVSALNAILIYSLVSSVGGIFLVLGVFIILKYRIWEVLAAQLCALAIILSALFLGGLL